MATLYILVGTPAVGKSTWAREHSNGVIVSSDVERINKYGYLSEENPQAIFSTMKKKTLDFLSKGENVYYDATNISRRRRRILYTEVKRVLPDVTVTVVLIHKPLEQILKQNEERNKVDNEYSIPNYVVENYYKNIQPPRLEVDCDSIIIESPSFDEYKKEYESELETPHCSPYHQETISEHIQLVVNNVPTYLKEVAEFHDLGKPICRIEDTKKTLASRYIRSLYTNFYHYNQHENVSAIYYLIANKDNLTDKVLYNTEIIYQHMKMFNGISEKVKRLNKLTEDLLKDLELFNKADKAGKIVDEEVYNKYKILQNIPSDSLLGFYEKQEDIKISPNYDKMLFTICYLHSGVDFTDRRILNARGITLDINSNIVTIGFEKFFNYNQPLYLDKTFVKERTTFDTTQSVKAYEKLDGTFISLSTYENNFIVSTTGSTKSDYTPNAIKYFSNLPESKELYEYLNNNNLSLFFEYTSPKNIICIHYNEDRYTIIGARKNNLESPLLDYKEIAIKFNFPTPKVKELTYKDLLEMKTNNKDIEGVVFMNNYRHLIKFKTNYWLEESHKGHRKLLFSDITSKNSLKYFTEVYVNDNSDDLFTALSDINFDITEIQSLFTKVDNLVKIYNHKINSVTFLNDKEVGLSNDLSSLEKNCIFYTRNSGKNIRENSKIIFRLFQQSIEE